jgi:flavorubredoxin
MGKETFKALKVSDRVYWVGAIDWGLRNFHGYLTSRGTTYNAFLILADKVTLIDTVKPNFYDEMMARIADVIDPHDIDIVVSNHSEMDHSGALPRLFHGRGNTRLIASAKGKEALEQHFHWDREIEVVKTGDTVDLGNASLRFVETRMLHWPDSMFCFLEDEGVLFTNDAFGAHLATAERFADEIDPSVLRYESSKYYANILLHLSPIVKKLIDKLPSFNLDIKMIAPDHGPLYRRDFDGIVRAYQTWAEQRPTRKAVLVYDTMWKSTELMARAVVDGLAAGGARIRLLSLDSAHRSDVVTELLDAGALLVGSPTINNQIYPTVADVMNYLKGLKPKNLVGASFGSYGWSGESVRHLDAMLGDMAVDLVRPGLGVKYTPTADDLAECRALGLLVAERLTALSEQMP